VPLLLLLSCCKHLPSTIIAVPLDMFIRHDCI
jgi:hypothetical protein